MLNKIFIRRLAITVLTLSAAFSTALQAEQQVLINVTSGSGQTQGMAMVLANQMQQQGAKVSMVLCDSAADLALKTYQGEILLPMNATPGQLLNKLQQGGAIIQVCALYLPNRKISAADLAKGITPAVPGNIAAQMLAAEVKVFSF
ncbi:hypothetical protein VT06_08405 [Arsukibacterium sp. MJ3]|jgi:predicted peroxiredoxin|uniref:DsrE family protein n=1 Tax=Arsukibacterium sp. MJ3 TaxID=1632859 RepID=UPI0006270792|nr:DsrE family protein [Arsukibacterium sp. MJ3]KKO49001.1 hypothetical protein VT06_08405 [Arsukibacterium sp. MJ3]